MAPSDDDPVEPAYDEGRQTVSASRVADEASYIDIDSRRRVEANAVDAIAAFAQAHGLMINSQPRPLWMIATDLRGDRETPYRRHLEIEVDVRRPL